MVKALLEVVVVAVDSVFVVVMGAVVEVIVVVDSVGMAVVVIGIVVVGLVVGLVVGTGNTPSLHKSEQINKHSTEAGLSRQLPVTVVNLYCICCIVAFYTKSCE